MVARKIDLEEKRVFVPTPMIQEPFFSLPVVVEPTEQQTATEQETVVPAPVVDPPAVVENENEEHVLQDPLEPVATDEGEQQQPPGPEIPVAVAPQRPQRTRRPAISDNYEVYNSE